MEGRHTTDCYCTDRHGTAPGVRSQRSSDHCRRWHNLRLADAHSSGARYRGCLLEEGATARYVVMNDQDQTTQLTHLGILQKIILGTRGTEGQCLRGHLDRPWGHDKAKLAGVLCASSGWAVTIERN